MRRPKVGDIIEVPTELGYFYGLVTHRHDWGDVARFWNIPFATPQKNHPAFLDQEKLVTIQCLFKGDIKRGLVKVVGKISVPDSLKKFPLFRSGNPDYKTKSNEIVSWWVWDGDNETHVGILTEELEKLPIAGAADNQFLVSFLEGNAGELNDSLPI